MEETRNACAIIYGGKFLGKRRLKEVGGERWEIEKKSQDYLQCGFPKIEMLK
jgi:hypothetical protein